LRPTLWAGRLDRIMATRKRHSPEQIVRKLMAADRLLAEGKDTHLPLPLPSGFGATARSCLRLPLLAGRLRYHGRWCPGTVGDLDSRPVGPQVQGEVLACGCWQPVWVLLRGRLVGLYINCE
jgi:hypothetical protein